VSLSSGRCLLAVALSALALRPFTAPAQVVAGQWTWRGGSSAPGQSGAYGTRGVAATSNAPGARYGAASWTDLAGNLWLFGGDASALSASSGLQFLNDLWKYDTARGLWTWVGGSSSPNQGTVWGTRGVPDASNGPGARPFATSWTDRSGNLWLFGGQVADPGGGVGFLHELWKYDPASGLWTWMGGGHGDDVEGSYGTLGIPSPSNLPGGRSGAASWTDANGDLWMFGGAGFPARGPNAGEGDLNDLWRYGVSTGLWTWMGGSPTLNQPGVYGTLAFPSASSVPGARDSASSWVDPAGNFWLFGGRGFASDGSPYADVLNDLWKYDVRGGTWTWMGGSSVSGQHGTNGARGFTSPMNVPGARWGAAAWPDAKGNLFLFGGYSSFSTTGADALLSDLWRWDPATGLFTWLSGPGATNQPGSYGTPGTASASTFPGARLGAAAFVSGGDFWMFGGMGAASASGENPLNDLWVFREPAGESALVPVVLDGVSGVGGSLYTTELTLSARSAEPLRVDLVYAASAGGGSGTASIMLAPGETRILPSALAYLRDQGLAIPSSGAVGTLLATFDGLSNGPFVGARTFTPGGGGTFGLFYTAAAASPGMLTVIGLQENASQRSNLALVNAGSSALTLSVTLFGAGGNNLATLPDQTLPPYGWAQINRPLQGLASAGRAVVTRTLGTSPFTAYGVLNDAVTSDGSFIPPLLPGNGGPADRFLPIVLDAHGVGGSHYTTELTLINLPGNPLPVTLVYTASLGGGSGEAAVTLDPGEQRIVPDAIAFLRSLGLAIPDDGSSVGGSLLFQVPSGTPPSLFAVGARTFTPAPSGGTFGLFYTGLQQGECAWGTAYVKGLQQSAAQRSNLAVVNRGDASDAITLEVAYFDGAGAALGAPASVTLAPGEWMQFNQPLAAFGAATGYARIRKTSGGSRFVAYGVLNDAVTSDGSYIPMTF
jgi:hypothetical protein